MFPPCLELLFDALAQSPQRHARGRVEDLGAPMRRDREHRSGLGEEVRPREAPAEGRRPEVAELALRVPPLRQVQLAEAGDDDAKFQQAVEVNCCAVVHAHR